MCVCEYVSFGPPFIIIFFVEKASWRLIKDNVLFYC